MTFSPVACLASQVFQLAVNLLKNSISKLYAFDAISCAEVPKESKAKVDDWVEEEDVEEVRVFSTAARGKNIASIKQLFVVQNSVEVMIAEQGKGENCCILRHKQDKSK